MIRFILCEGETDATLIGLYLEKMTNWRYTNEQNIVNKIKIPKTLNFTNKYVSYYKIENNELLICAVGGKDGFGEFYKKFIHRIINLSNNDENEFRIAIITDADDSSIFQIENNILTQLNGYISNIKNNEWKTNYTVNAFGDNAKIELLLTVIPKDHGGALESVLLDALEENDDGKYIVNESKKFIDCLDENNYIHNDRLKLKSKLGVALSVFYPDKVFSQFDQKLNIIDWSSYDALKENFTELLKI